MSTPDNTEEDFQVNVASTSSTKLCEIIATFRYIGLLRDEALLAMVELAQRRALGDAFPFEDEIQKFLADLPKLKQDVNSMPRIPSLGKIF